MRVVFRWGIPLTELLSCRPIVTLLLLTALLPADTLSTRFHLTAHPWHLLSTPKERYLDAIEGVCRFSVRHQNASGAIIDPFLHREHQYATPYFAYAVGALVSAGRARDLLPNGIRAMEHSKLLFPAAAKQSPNSTANFSFPH